jgi:hypothetical protein
MLKQLGITTMALAGLLGMAAPKKADARVHFGVYLGGPAYTYPVAPVAPVPAAPYAYAPDYGYYGDPAYAAPAPAYVEPYYAAPSYGFGIGIGGWGHDHDHWGGHEFRGHENFRGGHEGGGHRR